MSGARRVPPRCGAYLPRLVIVLAALGTVPFIAGGQIPTTAGDSLADSSYTASPLYAQSEPLAVTFTVNVGQLRHDRDDKAKGVTPE